MSSVKNLDQIRAANALKHCAPSVDDKSFRGVDDGEVVKKVPTMIRENGFLGALAFALESSKGGWKNPGHNKVFECILDHLKALKRVPDTLGSPYDLMEYLVNDADSAKLRDVTAESLLYMNYLRRFVRPKQKDDASQRKDS